MKITGKHPEKLNDPIIGDPQMHGRRWQIDYAYEPHSSYKKILKKPKDSVGEEIETRHNDWDISYHEFYDELEKEPNSKDFTVDIDVNDPTSLKEASQTAGINTTLNSSGKTNVKSSSSDSTKTPALKTGTAKPSLDGTGEDTKRKGSYDFFQYKKDNGGYGTDHMLKSKKISLSELIK